MKKNEKQKPSDEGFFDEGDLLVFNTLCNEIKKQASIINDSNNQSEVRLALLGIQGNGKLLTVLANNFLKQENLQY